METIFHEVPWPSAGHSVDLTKHLASTACASRIECRTSLRLADLTSVGLRPPGLAPAELIDTNADHYPRTRAWARWFHDALPECQGLTWMSRQDNSARAIVLFEDRADPADLEGQDIHLPLHAPPVIDEILALMERLQLGDAGP